VEFDRGAEAILEGLGIVPADDIIGRHDAQLKTHWIAWRAAKRRDRIKLKKAIHRFYKFTQADRQGEDKAALVYRPWAVEHSI